MSYASFLFDDFNDNSIDSSKWTLVGTRAATEVLGKFHTIAGNSGDDCKGYGTPKYDIRKGILAAKMSKTGTSADAYTVIGLSDPSGDNIRVFGRNTSTAFSVSSSGFGSLTNTQTDTSVFLGPSWVNGTWLGWTVESNTMYLLKSSDGANWTEIFHSVATAPINFDFSNAGLIIGSVNFGSTSTSVANDWDDATYFADKFYLASSMRVGGAWVNGVPKVRVGGAWVNARTKVRVGGSWVDAN